MKITKRIILPLVTVAMVTGPLVTAISCSHVKTYKLELSASEGVTLKGETTLNVAEGTKWKDVKKPTVEVGPKLTNIGWVDLDKYEYVEDETTINNDSSFRYVAYNPIEFNATITLQFDDKTVDLPFIQGYTWKDFKDFYDLDNHKPKKEGYHFQGWAIDGAIIQDDYVIGETLSVKALFKQITFTIKFTASEGGKIVKGQETMDVPENQKWSDLKLPEVETDEGYSFVGWSLGGELIEKDFPIISNLEINAEFTAETPAKYFDFECRVEGNANVAYLKKLSDSEQVLKSYVIPTKVKVSGVEYTVTWIRDNAFAKAKDVMENLTLPSGLVTIGNEVFKDMSHLKIVEMNCPNLTTISYGAFRNCSSLAKIVIPKNVTKIEQYAFDGCKNLEYARFEDNIHTWSIGAKKVRPWTTSSIVWAQYLRNYDTGAQWEWVKEGASELAVEKKDFKDVDTSSVANTYTVDKIHTDGYLTIEYKTTDYYEFDSVNSSIRFRGMSRKIDEVPPYGENIIHLEGVQILNNRILIPERYVTGDMEVTLQAKPGKYVPVNIDDVPTQLQPYFPTQAEFGKDYHVLYSLPSNYPMTYEVTVNNVSVKADKRVRVSRNDVFIPGSLINGPIKITINFTETWQYPGEIVEIGGKTGTAIEIFNELVNICNQFENSDEGEANFKQFYERIKVKSFDGETKAINDPRALIGSYIFIPINGINHKFRIVDYIRGKMIDHPEKKAALVFEMESVLCDHQGKAYEIQWDYGGRYYIGDLTGSAITANLESDLTGMKKEKVTLTDKDGKKTTASQMIAKALDPTGQKNIKQLGIKLIHRDIYSWGGAGPDAKYEACLWPINTHEFCGTMYSKPKTLFKFYENCDKKYFPKYDLTANPQPKFYWTDHRNNHTIFYYNHLTSTCAECDAGNWHSLSFCFCI